MKQVYRSTVRGLVSSVANTCKLIHVQEHSVTLNLGLKYHRPPLSNTTHFRTQVREGFLQPQESDGIQIRAWRRVSLFTSHKSQTMHDVCRQIRSERCQLRACAVALAQNMNENIIVDKITIKEASFMG